MSTTADENFKDYKIAERKALELVRGMQAVSAKKTDIELALLVAIFELHRGTIPPETSGAIVQGHLRQIIPGARRLPARPPVTCCQQSGKGL